MLTEQRFEEILRQLQLYGTVTVQGLAEQLKTSESTIRRDLTQLDKQGRLKKVFGGAVLTEKKMNTKDTQVADRSKVNPEEKKQIAAYAASLIKEDDFVYLDAGTTTGYMIDYLKEKGARYVTNGVSHAQRLAALGFKVILIGGELKSSTEAVVGVDALMALQKYHFSIGFWGTNGINENSGFTTPDNDEAMVKSVSLKQTKERYVLADHEKFTEESSVSFAGIQDALIISDRVDLTTKGIRNVINLSKLKQIGDFTSLR